MIKHLPLCIFQNVEVDLLKKFIQTVPSSFKGELYINLETKNAFSNLYKIIKTKEFTKLKGVVIGRSDIAGSFGLPKSKVDSDLI